MSRTVIAVVVAVVIAALTAVTFFVTSTSIEDKVKRDAAAQVKRAHRIIGQLAVLEAIDIQNKANRLAADNEFVQALQSATDENRQIHADRGFGNFTGRQKSGNRLPDIIALCNPGGDILAMNGVSARSSQRQWKNEKGEVILPALDVVRANRVTISDMWFFDNRLYKVGVAPVLDPTSLGKPNDEGVPIIGEIVVAYAQTAAESQQDKGLLGTDIAYYDGANVASTSFIKDGTKTEEDTDRGKKLVEILKAKQVKEGATTEIPMVTIDGTKYYAGAIAMPRAITNDDRIPTGYPPVTAGAMVLAPLEPDADTASGFGLVKKLLFLLGGGALVMAMLGLYLSHRRLVAQVDQIELGVTDIINGNVDRTFRPVGLELDGLANGLNVMLSRLLGRPEPGEEEFDEEGNPIIPGRVEFEEEDGATPPKTDPDLAALAQESEPDYYKRVFTEYVAQRKAVGSPDDVSFENFIAKLKVNEGKLKAQFQCRAVRFRVITKDNKVTLKPVPIFA
jgi:hypothetical protein